MDGGGEAVGADLPDVVIVEVKPQESFERTKEVTGNVCDLIFTQKESCESVSKVEVITISQVHYLVPETETVF